MAAMDLVVYVNEIKSLPRMDTFGKCDPYCVVEVAGVQQKTGVHKNCYDATFDEEFAFRHPGGASAGITIKVMDWDMMGKHDTVGTCEVSAEAVASVLAGDATALSLPVHDIKSKKPRTGYDKNPCLLEISLSSRPAAAGSIDPADQFATAGRSPSIASGLLGKASSSFKSTFSGAKNVSHSAEQAPIVAGKPPLPPSDDLRRTPSGGRDAKGVGGAKGGGGANEIIVRVIEVNHLPHMDLFGKCDAFCELTLGDREKPGNTSKKTKVHKNAYRASFGEDFFFPVPSGSTFEDLFIRVLDPDVTGQERIGKCIIPHARLNELLATSGESGVMILPVMHKGAARIGKDEQGTILKIEIKCQKSAGQGRYRPLGDIQTGFSSSFMQTSTGLRKAKSLGVRILEVKSLPRKDVTGKCDPYVTIELGPQEHKTGVVKNTFDAYYDEFFTFDAEGSQAFAPLIISVFDWDRLSKSDLIGQVEYSADQLNAMLDNYIGWKTGILDCNISHKGQVVIGEDKNKSVVLIEISILESLLKLDKDGFATRAGRASPDVQAKDFDPNRKMLGVSLDCIRHLPKTDTFGRCDSYVVIEMGPLSQKSKIIKNNYDPVFDHTFYFDAENGIPQNGLTISLYDYNAVSKDELLAVVSITEDRLNDVIKNPSGFKTEKSTLKFLNKGVNLKGNDGKSCEVDFALGSIKAGDAQPELKEKNAAKIANKLEETAVKAQQSILDLELQKKALQAELDKMRAEKAQTAKETEMHLEMASSVKSLLPWKGITALDAGTYSDITILAQEHEGDREIRCPVHMDILWARCYGLRPHIEHARELQTLAPLEVYTVDVQQMARGAIEDIEEFGGVIAEGEEYETLYETWEQLKIRVTKHDSINSKKDGTKTDGDKAPDLKNHEWSPMTCISVPGTVFGTPMRCSCAHGSKFRDWGKGGDTTGKKQEDKGELVIRIRGCAATVVAKVLRYLYGFQEEVDRFFDEEVRDAVLLAKTFVLKFLLTQLYDQDHFPNWGCAMWDAARDMAERVSEELNPNIRGIEGMAHNWLDELLFDADVHFEKDIFEKDGAMTLSDTGCKILLRHSALNCEEMLVFVSVMKFVQVRWGEIDSAQVAQWDRKQEKKEKEKLKKEEEERQAQLEGTLLDSPRDEDKDKIIVKPEAYKPRFKYEGVAKPFLRLVRYPFISPERLNKEVQMEERFLKISPTDSRGMPLVLRAVFHQDGQRIDGWDTELCWTPRAGSVIYNGEWEWIYGPSALSEGRWPVMDKFAQAQFCWTSEEEILAHDLAKVELFDLDTEGVGEPSVHDLLGTFMYHFPMRSLTEEADQSKHGSNSASFRSVPHGNRNSSKQGKEVMAHILKEIRKTKRGRALGPEALAEAVRKAATSAKTFRAMADTPGMAGNTRHVFAVGRVRKGISGWNKYKSTDPRLHGRGFVIYWSHAEARDAKSRFSGMPMSRHAGVSEDECFLWEEVESTQKLRIEYHAPGDREGYQRSRGVASADDAHNA